MAKVDHFTDFDNTRWLETSPEIENAILKLLMLTDSRRLMLFTETGRKVKAWREPLMGEKALFLFECKGTSIHG